MTTGMTVRGAAIGLALGLALLAGGCTSDGSDEASGGSAASDSSVAGNSFADTDGAASGVANESGESGEAEPAARKAGSAVDVDAAVGSTQQIRTAQVTVRVKGIDAAAARVRGVATGLGGLVQDEDSTFGTPEDAAGSGSSVITLRVPADQLDEAIEQLGKIGTRLDLRTSSQDVTTTIADLDSRLTSQEKSVDRMRALLAEAVSVKDVIAIESELSTREADLESLQAQARAVKDKAALSTLVVTLELPEAAGNSGDDGDGFLDGLATGWDATVSTAIVVLTVLGVLLPLALAAAVIGVPAWLAYRRFGRRRAPSTP